MTPYTDGRRAATAALGLEKTAIALYARQRKDPFQEIHRRIAKAFKVRTPKFDFSKLIARLLRSPFRQIGLQLAGKGRPLRF